MAGKCGHPACRCAITGDHAGFCSDYCSEQNQTQAERCECGHPACSNSAEKE